MEGNLSKQLLNEIEEFKQGVSEKDLKILKVNLMERIIKRLASFSPDCHGCEEYLLKFQGDLEVLKSKQGAFEKNDVKIHQDLLSAVISHLQKEHKLVTKGFYTSTYMLLGLSIGMIFGLVIFDNLGLGLPVGIAIGVAVGASMDADAEKKGLTI